jgi:hypothetical protein
MANYELPNDVIRTFVGALGSMSAGGAVVPNPGATYAVTLAPAGVANMVINGADVTVNATGPNTVGIVATFVESGGTPQDETAFVWTFDTVDDLTPRAVSFNPAATVTDVAQAVPAQTPPAGGTTLA